MTVFNTPIGKVRYSGVFRFALAVPSGTRIGTTVIQRSNSGVKLIEVLRTRSTGAIICPATGKTIAYKLPGGNVLRGDGSSA